MIPSYGSMAAVLPLPALYYWAVWRPDLMPAWLAFLIGLVYGALVHAPLGLHSLLFLLVLVGVRRQRRVLVGLGCPMFWTLYAAMVLVYTVAEWMLSSILAAHPMPVAGALFGAVVTAAAFPIVALPLAQIHRLALRGA